MLLQGQKPARHVWQAVPVKDTIKSGQMVLGCAPEEAVVADTDTAGSDQWFARFMSCSREEHHRRLHVAYGFGDLSSHR